MEKSVTSIHNPEIKLYRRLQSRHHFREKNRLAVLEGERLFQDAWSAGIELRSVFFTRDYKEKHLHIIENLPSTAARFLVPDALFESMCNTCSPQGIAAIVNIPDSNVNPACNYQFCLLLDALQDPGNLGTVIRTAAAAGVDAVYLGPGNADLFNPKVLRASMGGVFRIPCFQIKDLERQLSDWRERQFRFLAAVPGGNTVYCHVDFLGPIVLMIGNEGRGLQDKLVNAADIHMSIPLFNGMESLNAAAAAAVVIYEAIRQRK